MKKEQIDRFTNIGFTCATLLSILTLCSCTDNQNVVISDSSRKEIKVDIPKTQSTYYVDCSNKAASDTGSGSFETPFKTINAAAQKAVAGDIITVREGVYRERVTPKVGGKKGAPIVYQTYPGEKVVIKGSEEWKPSWKEMTKKPGVYNAELPPTLFGNNPNPFHIGISISSKDRELVARPTKDDKMLHTLGQIFINGKPAWQVQTIAEMEKMNNSWIVAKDGKSIFINFPAGNKPNDCMVEISVRNRIFSPYRRKLSNIHVKGFTMEHCANQGPFPQAGALSVRSGRNWVIENNTVRYAKTIGIDCGSETWDVNLLKETHNKDKKLIIGGGHIIRNNVVSDNGLSGISGWNHKGTKIVNNIIERNNRLKLDKKIAKWEEWGAIKLHCSDAIIEGNLVRDNECFGIWIDNGFSNARISRNVIINNLKSGIFLELGGGKGAHCTVDNNIIIGTRGASDFYKGYGVYTHDASKVIVANNLIYKNEGSGVLMRTITNRTFGGKKTETSDQRIFNNLIIDNRGAISLPLPYKRSKNNHSNHNYFAGNGDKMFRSIWSIDGKNRKKLKDKLKSIFPKEGFDEAFEKWIKDGKIVPGAWQELMKMDTDSVFTNQNLNISFDNKKLELNITPSEKLLSIMGTKIPTVKADFDGNQAEEGGKVIPGPFQTIKKETTIKLWPIKASRTFFDIELPKLKNEITNNSWDLSQKSDVWFSSTQFDQTAINIMTPAKAYDGVKVLQTRSTKGVSKSKGQYLLFKAPADGWYSVDLAGKLMKRTAHTAGYVKTTIFLASPSMGKFKKITSVALNTKGGFGRFSDKLSYNDTIKIRKGCYLAVAVQVVAPGPAPAGYASLDVTKFIVRNEIKSRS